MLAVHLCRRTLQLWEAQGRTDSALEASQPQSSRVFCCGWKSACPRVCISQLTLGDMLSHHNRLWVQVWVVYDVQLLGTVIWGDLCFRRTGHRGPGGESTRIIVALMLATREQAETVLAAQSRKEWHVRQVDEVSKRGEHSQRISHLCRVLSVLEHP